MATSSIRVKSKSEYIIEVNDNGDTISFDPNDTKLSSKLFEMYDKMDETIKKYEAKAMEIDSRPDEPYKNIGNILNDNDEVLNKFMTKNQYDGSKLIDEFYTEARTVIDAFIGNGSCQKIFGDNNYNDMFADLFETLKPEFEKIGINANNVKKTAIDKHSPNRATRRALK